MDARHSATADDVRDACLAVEGVAAMSGGVLGEVGTYLPGRRVMGVRLHDDRAEVHIALHDHSPVRQTADAVAQALEQMLSIPVIVWVDELLPAQPG